MQEVKGRQIVEIDDFFFDDCPVCQAQKKADQEGRLLTSEELIEGMREVRRLGLGDVGGPAFDSEK